MHKKFFLLKVSSNQRKVESNVSTELLVFFIGILDLLKAGGEL